MSSVSFSRYAALVKNLRGVILVDPDDDLTPNFLRWLNRRFKYRVLGIPPKVREGLRSKGLTPTKQVKNLHYPSEELMRLVNEALKNAGSIPEEVIESAVLSSAYVSPMLVFGDSYVRPIRNLSIHTVESQIKLNNQLMKLHMRIADYSILDYYEENLKIVKGLWGGESFSNFKDRRRKLALKDSKRYWRLSGKGVKADRCESHIFLAYADVVVKAFGEVGVKSLVKAFSFESVGAGLVLTPSVVIPKYLLG